MVSVPALRSNALLTLTILAVALLFMLHELRLELRLQGAALIRRERKGCFAIEIYRRVVMLQLPAHVSAFPVPRERRIRVRRFWGIALSQQEISVALPVSACENLSGIAPGDFDPQFPSWLRSAA
ncbi:conserved hypothetical protein [Burkholderiales bacterium 8X]|nr:conserved hypothetical protein [Burkholderiales bacterium 8X]